MGTKTIRDPEEMLSACKAAREVPGGAVSPESIWRWHARGIKARNGETIKLRAFKFGRKLRYRRGDLLDFAKRLATANAAGFDAAA